jgi:ATP-dependent Clp protease ATP-binding subunit ClpB
VTAAARDEVLRAVGAYFKPELINRLDEQLVFNKLPPSVILDIVGLRLKEVQQRLDARRVTLDVSDAAKSWLADRGFSDQFGARAVSRVIRDKIVSPVAVRLLDGTVK